MRITLTRKNPSLDPLAVLPAANPYPKTVAADAAGNFYAGCCGGPGGLEQWRTDGRNLERTWTADAGRVRGLACLPDGSVAAAVKLPRGCAIVRFSSEGGRLDSWGVHGTAPGELCNPTGIAFDATTGRLFVLDCTEWDGKQAMRCNRIQMFTTDGNFCGGWGETGTDPGQFNLPVGIAVMPDGTVAVADSWNCRIQLFMPDGALLSCLGGPGIAPGRFNVPQGLCARPDGTLLAADTYNNRIQHFTAGGEPLAVRGQRGTADSCFWLPCGIARSADGILAVADTMNGCIKLFDEGAWLA